MRVIAGKFRSRALRSLRGMDIRPTSDRLRETLFNVLTAGNPEALVGSVWVDLFAGTGAVGIEAMSRGAAMVYFVERSRQSAQLVEANLRSLGVRKGYQLLQQDASRALASLEAQKVAPEYIYLDPPYRIHDSYGHCLNLLGALDLASQALVITEHEKTFDPGDEFGRLHRTRILRQGDSALSFFRC